MRLGPALSSVLLASIATAGCGGGDTTVIQRTTTTIESSAGPTTATSTVTTTSTAGGSTSETASGIDTSGPFTFFQLPSGNIACAMSRRDVRCDIRRYRYSPPARPGDCPLDWGDSISVDAGGAQFTCHGDTVFDPGAAILDYGRRVTRDGFTCSSDASTGVSCHNAAGRGFALAIQAFRLD